MAKVTVNPGVCGFKTVINVTADENQSVNVTIDSACEAVKAMEAELKGLDGYTEVLGKFGTSKISETAAKLCRHAACPVPSAIFKGVEVACSLALPAPVSMEITND